MIIAQLSDIHADGSQRALDRLDKVLDWLQAMRPDAVMISGDLAEAEQPASYPQVRARLDKLQVPYALVPGNVDDRSLLREAFGERMVWPTSGALNSVAVIGGALRLIGLDVTVPGAHHGDAAPILSWLEQTLASSSLPAIIFQHQHPFPCGIDNKDRNICYAGKELAAVIEAAGDTVLALTCGHVHRPMFTRFAGRQATMAPSVARANKLRLDGREPEISDPPGLLIHHLRQGALVTHAIPVV